MTKIERRIVVIAIDIAWVFVTKSLLSMSINEIKEIMGK